MEEHQDLFKNYLIIYAVKAYVVHKRFLLVAKWIQLTKNMMFLNICTHEGKGSR